MANWMIYGATGYTGSRIAKQAKSLGHSPILAGRSEHLLYKLSKETDCPYRVFDLQNNKVVQNMIQDVDILLNCAGPFIFTTPRLLSNCLITNTHYLDITGEVAVFEYCAKRHRLAEEAHTLICPGIGFDVVPTDHLAVELSKALPDVTCPQTLVQWQLSSAR